MCIKLHNNALTLFSLQMITAVFELRDYSGAQSFSRICNIGCVLCLDSNRCLYCHCIRIQ